MVQDQKIISVEVAKWLSINGFFGMTDHHKNGNLTVTLVFKDKVIVKQKGLSINEGSIKLTAPTYFSVWQWLWTNAGIKIDICENLDGTAYGSYTVDDDNFFDTRGCSNPEEALVNCIEDLAKRNVTFTKN